MQELTSSLSSMGAFVVFLFGFGFLVFVHELGHFLVAKAVGVRCTQFAIGFGQSILAWRKGVGFRVGSTEAEYNRLVQEELDRRRRSGDLLPEDLDTANRSQEADKVAEELGLGETEYRLNWAPLGGYVKMLGQEDLNPDAQSDDPRSFMRKKPWQRALVLSAGVVMNLIFGVIFFIIAFGSGVRFPAAEVGMIDPTGPAATVFAQGHEDEPGFQGVQVGDVITHVNGEEITDFSELMIRTALASSGDRVVLRVEREGVEEPLVFQLQPEVNERMDLLSLKIQPASTLEVAAKPQSGPLAEAGIEPGMTLVAVDDRPVHNFGQYYRAVMERQGQPLRLTFRVDEPFKLVGATVEPRASLIWPEQGPQPHLLGMVPATRVVGVLPGSPAAEAGIQGGDVLARVGEASWPTLDQVRQQVQAATRSGQPVEVVVGRDDRQVPLSPIEPTSQGMIGVEMAPAADHPVIAHVRADSPLAEMNLPPGSRLVSFNDKPIESYAQLQRRLAQLLENAELPVTARLTYQLSVAGNPTESAEITLDADQAAALAQASWMVPLGPSFFTEKRTLIQAKTPWQAVVLGWEKANQTMSRVYVTLLRLFQGTVKPKHLQGPVGITHTGTTVAQQGWTYLMFFLGLLSINLAVINLLPIPILDGGHLLFLAIEKVKGSPVSARVQTAALFIGLAIIASLFLVVTFNDVMNLFRG